MNTLRWLLCCLIILCASTAQAVSIQSMKTETDTEADGTIDYVMVEILENCLVVESRVDNNNDGSYDYISYMEYNSGGYAVITRNDDDADGIIDSLVYIRENLSTGTAGESLFITEYDDNADGVIDSFYSSLSLTEGSSSIIKTYQGEGAYIAGGAPTSITYHTNNACGNPLKSEHDDDADGQIDSVDYIEYDNGCSPVLTQTDSDNDGDIDQVTRTSYDDKCRPTNMQINMDMTVLEMSVTSDTATTMTYTDDANGYPTKLETSMRMTETIMGQTMSQETSSVSYMTYEYGGGDCGGPSECACCTENDEDDTETPSSSSVTEEQVAELYVATFNRAPDSAGLYYWVNLSFGGNPAIEQIAESFFDQPETQALYPSGNTDEEFINAIYMHLFNREADAEGLAYWVGSGGLGGGMPRSVMIEALKNGATGTDREILDNKTEVGMYFVNKGLADVVYSLENITEDDSTVEEAKAAIDLME